MLRRYRDHLIATAEISALFIIAASLISVIVNTIRFRPYGISFLELATPTDLFFSGFSAMFDMAIVAAELSAGWVIFLGCRGPMLKSRNGHVRKYHALIIIALAIAVNFSFLLISYTTAKIYEEFYRYSRILVGISFGLFTGVLLAAYFQQAKEKRNWIYILGFLIVAIYPIDQLLERTFQADDMPWAKQTDSRPFVVNGPKECGPYSRAVWIGSQSILVTCGSIYAATSREGVTLFSKAVSPGFPDSLRPLSAQPQWWQVFPSPKATPRSGWMKFVDRNSISYKAGTASYWTVYHARDVRPPEAEDDGFQDAQAIYILEEAQCIRNKYSRGVSILKFLVLWNNGKIQFSNDLGLAFRKALGSTTPATFKFVCGIDGSDARATPELDLRYEHVKRIFGTP